MVRVHADVWTHTTPVHGGRACVSAGVLVVCGGVKAARPAVVKPYVVIVKAASLHRWSSASGGGISAGVILCPPAGLTFVSITLTVTLRLHRRRREEMH